MWNLASASPINWIAERSIVADPKAAALADLPGGNSEATTTSKEGVSSDSTRKWRTASARWISTLTDGAERMGDCLAKVFGEFEEAGRGLAFEGGVYTMNTALRSKSHRCKGVMSAFHVW